MVLDVLSTVSIVVRVLWMREAFLAGYYHVHQTVGGSAAELLISRNPGLTNAYS
jgi:hypothetical protein